MTDEIKVKYANLVTEEELKELAARRELPFKERIWKDLDIPARSSYGFSETDIRAALLRFTPEPNLHHPQAVETAYEVKAESYEANPKPNGTACSKCCSGFLTIKIERQTAVLIKNATEGPKQARPKDRNHVNTVKFTGGYGEADEQVIAMLEKMEWWGIAGKMTAEVMDCTAQKAQTYMSSEDKQKVADAAAARAAVIQQAAAFKTETYEPKGPPKKIDWFCRAIPAGDYKIRGIDKSIGTQHSTYEYNKTAFHPAWRGLNIFNDNVQSGRKIDIHMGKNAIFTVGCILLAPDLRYEPLRTEQEKKELFAKYASFNSPPVTPVDKKWNFDSREFSGTKPFWSARASLNKVTQLVELMENFRRIFQGISGKEILLTTGGHKTATKCEEEKRKEIAAEIKQHKHEKAAKKDERNKLIETAIGLDCIKVEVNNPYGGIFKDIKILEDIRGKLVKLPDSIKITSLTIIDEDRYSVEAGGKLYELTVNKTDQVQDD